jgi:hypothetical protein
VQRENFVRPMSVQGQERPNYDVRSMSASPPKATRSLRRTE